MSFNRGLKKIFSNGIFPKSTADIVDKIDVEEWGKEIKFWRRSRNGLGEIDVCIEFQDFIIGIEVKLDSNLSSDDDISYDETEDDDRILKESKNQLNREARMLKEWAPDKKKILIFVAKEKLCQNVYNEVVNERNLLDKEIIFGYLSWEDALEGLGKIKAENHYEKIMVGDLNELLIKKGFERFKGFNFEEQLVSTDCWKYKGSNDIFSFNTKIQVGVEYYGFGKKHA